MTGERTLTALSEIGDGLQSIGESFVALAGESALQRKAVKDLGTKIDKLQATADDIKSSIAEDAAKA